MQKSTTSQAAADPNRMRMTRHTIEMVPHSSGLDSGSGSGVALAFELGSALATPLTPFFLWYTAVFSGWGTTFSSSSDPFSICIGYASEMNPLSRLSSLVSPFPVLWIVMNSAIMARVWIAVPAQAPLVADERCSSVGLLHWLIQIMDLDREQQSIKTRGVDQRDQSAIDGEWNVWIWRPSFQGELPRVSLGKSKLIQFSRSIGGSMSFIGLVDQWSICRKGGDS